jgi:hypothetical protein
LSRSALRCAFKRGVSQRSAVDLDVALDVKIPQESMDQVDVPVTLLICILEVLGWSLDRGSDCSYRNFSVLTSPSG